MTIQDIHQRAILVGLRIASWSAKKYDKEVSEQATAAHGTDTSAGRFTKSLLPSTVKVEKTVENKSKSKRGDRKTKTVTVETNSYIELKAHIAATWQWVYDQTLPWNDKGWRMLPMGNWTPFTDGMRERQAQGRRLLDAFLADYPKLREDARRILNGMFKEDDYPDDMASRFSWDIEYKPVPVSDFRVSLSSDEISSLSAAVEARVQSAVQDAQDDCVKRLYDCLSHIHDRLTTTKVSKRKADEGEKIAATFRDTLVENARELCDVLTRLNVGGDAKLEQFRRETELLAAVEPETLRDNADVAAETAKQAQNILDAMTKTYGKNLFAK